MQKTYMDKENKIQSIKLTYKRTQVKKNLLKYI